MSESSESVQQHSASTQRRLELFARYGCAGAAGTVTHFAVMWTLLPAVSPVMATTSGAVSGCLVNYVLARTFVFYSSQPARVTFPRFFAVGLVCILANALTVHWLIEVLHVVAAQLVATGVVLGLGFFLNRYWTFNE